MSDGRSVDSDQASGRVEAHEDLASVDGIETELGGADDDERPDAWAANRRPDLIVNFDDMMPISSPTLSPNVLASVWPRMMPGKSSGARLVNASSAPLVIARRISVTSGSSAGSIPLISIGVGSSRDTISNPLPMMPGAEPATPGIFTRASSLSRESKGADLVHVDVRLRADDAIAHLALDAGHERERDDERHHADGDAERSRRRRSAK